MPRENTAAPTIPQELPPGQAGPRSSAVPAAPLGASQRLLLGFPYRINFFRAKPLPYTRCMHLLPPDPTDSRTLFSTGPIPHRHGASYPPVPSVLPPSSSPTELLPEHPIATPASQHPLKHPITSLSSCCPPSIPLPPKQSNKHPTVPLTVLPPSKHTTTSLKHLDPTPQYPSPFPLLHRWRWAEPLLSCADRAARGAGGTGRGCRCCSDME